MPQRVLLLAVFSLLILGLRCAALAAELAARPADAIVVCAEVLRPALKKWIAHRESQGHRLEWMSNEGSVEELDARITDRFAKSPFRSIVIVGDAISKTRPSSLQTATHMVKATVNVKWGSEPTIASDAPYADMDGDLLPEVAIGRLPADDAKELENLADRIIAYETETDFGPWRSKLNFVAGVGGFGAIADMALELTTKTFLTDGIPSAYLTSMTYGSWRSAYCPDPRDFHKTTLRRLNEGCLFWIYIGHGQRTYLDRVRVPGQAHGIFSVKDAVKLDARTRPPIAIFLSCYAGAFDNRDDCLSEVMIKQPGGPIAVYSGSRVTMPYAMAVMSHSMLRLYFVEKQVTLGELIQRAKHELVTVPDMDDPADRHRTMLDKLAAVISPSRNMLAEERAEHVVLFNLLGDPLLRLPRPSKAKVVVPDEARAGESIDVRIEGAVGEAVVELICRRDLTRKAVPHRSQFVSTPAVLASYNQTYEMANDPVWTRRTVKLNGAKALKLSIPKDARGPCFVRVHVTGPAGFSIGAGSVYIRQFQQPPDSDTNGPN